MTLAGVLLAIGGSGHAVGEPAGRGRTNRRSCRSAAIAAITVYDRVVVGSDGTATSLYAVDRAAEVVQAAQAKLVVVTAYRDSDPGRAATPVEGKAPRHLRRGGGSQSPGEVGHRADQGTSDGTRAAARPGDPAKALLDTVGSNPANLIVVGNRGLGASKGQLVGSVPP